MQYNGYDRQSDLLLSMVHHLDISSVAWYYTFIQTLGLAIILQQRRNDVQCSSPACIITGPQTSHWQNQHWQAPGTV